MPIGFIDPPGPFAPIKQARQLQDFLIHMRQYPQDVPQVQTAIRTVQNAPEFRRPNPDLEELLGKNIEYDSLNLNARMRASLRVITLTRRR